jgi:hypothetical protein
MNRYPSLKEQSGRKDTTMKLLRDRNDRVLLGAAGVLLGVGVLIAAANAPFGMEADLMASTRMRP